MVPGPLFTFAAYLGGVIDTGAPAAAGALLAVLAIFLPSFLLVFGLLPFWSVLRARPRAQGALAGVNAAVAGLLAAALVDPVLSAAVHTWREAVFALGATAVLMWFRPPPWAFVPVSGVLFAVLARLA
jgi:chromate transporter